MTEPQIPRGRRHPYSVHPGVAVAQRWVAGLRSRTGRTLDEWIDLVHAEGPAGARSRRDWLRKSHGLPANSAAWIADRAEGKGGEDDDPAAYLAAAPGWVEAMFAGKEGLRPVYDALLQVILRLGDDVRICPARTAVPVYRTHVFAQIKPASKTRLDLGLALGPTRTPKRLLTAGARKKGDRITRRIPLRTIEEIDSDVRRWLRIAYTLDR